MLGYSSQRFVCTSFAVRSALAATCELLPSCMFSRMKTETPGGITALDGVMMPVAVWPTLHWDLGATEHRESKPSKK